MSTLHVVIPIDESALSEAVIPHVRNGLRPARTHLLMAVRGRETAIDPASRAEAQRRLNDVALRHWGDDMALVETIIRAGPPADAILSTARERDAAVIALTAHGRSGYDTVLLGRVAEKVIRTGDRPVLVLRAQAEAPADGGASLLERVLVTHDGSPRAGHAIDALGRLDDEHRANLTIFGASEDDDQEATLLLAALEGETMRARLLGFHAKAEVERGDAASKIVERATREKATLIVMTTHGRSGISRWLLGSVTEKVLRATEIPLLILR